MDTDIVIAIVFVTVLIIAIIIIIIIQIQAYKATSQEDLKTICFIMKQTKHLLNCVRTNNIYENFNTSVFLSEVSCFCSSKHYGVGVDDFSYTNTPDRHQNQNQALEHLNPEPSAGTHGLHRSHMIYSFWCLTSMFSL